MNEFDQHAFETLGVYEGDGVAHRADARRFIDEGYSFAAQMRQRLRDIPDAVADVVNAGSLLGDELPDRSVRT